jgi:glycerol uptake facilitator protein
VNFGEIVLSEIIGTAALTLLGCGVVANVVLAKTKGNNGGFLMINIGWCFAVMAGILLAVKTGAHLNPAVTLGLWAGDVDSYSGYTQIDVNVGNTIAYLLGEMVGAFIGAVLCWASYRNHFDDEGADSATKLAVFSTGPAIRNTTWNFTTEVIGTFVLVFAIMALGFKGNAGPGALGFLVVPFIVLVIGTSLGGPTGYAINPARDLGPRIAHALLPFRGKGDSDWAYSWIPVVGPLVGGVIGGLLGQWVF